MKKQSASATKLSQKRAAKKAAAKKSKPKAAPPISLRRFPGEWFEYTWEIDPVKGRIWGFDIEKAQRYLESAPESVLGDMHISKLENALGVYDVSEDYALSDVVDIDRPIIMAFLPEPWREQGERVGVLIDGMHRAYKRRALGYDTVVAALLPDEVTASILLRPEEIRRRKRLHYEMQRLNA